MKLSEKLDFMYVSDHLHALGHARLSWAWRIVKDEAI